MTSFRIKTGIAFGTMVPGRLVQRDNRFRAQVEIESGTVAVHVPNSGRLGELLVPEAQVWLAPADPATLHRRRTHFDLVLVMAQDGATLVSIDARLPSALAEQALRAGRLPGLEYLSMVRREVPLGQSRIDLLADHNGRRCWIETKSVTLVRDGIALFPDAPTARGRRHVLELTAAAQDGDKSVVLFVVQRVDARYFKPNTLADPQFAEALALASAKGVEVVAVRCQVGPEFVAIDAAIPVELITNAAGDSGQGQSNGVSFARLRVESSE